MAKAECLARGIPLDTPPKLILDALKMSRGLDMQRQRLVAASMIGAFGSVIATALTGKPVDNLIALQHLYSDAERADITAQRQEAEAVNRSLRMMSRFQSIARRMDDDGR